MYWKQWHAIVLQSCMGKVRHRDSFNENIYE